MKLTANQFGSYGWWISYNDIYLLVTGAPAAGTGMAMARLEQQCPWMLGGSKVGGGGAGGRKHWWGLETDSG